MMLAETEYRHQVEAVIRPFRELLLGLVLHLRGHAAGPASALRPVPAGVAHRAGNGADQGGRAEHSRCAPSSARISRPCAPAFCWVAGGEFGVALLTLLIQAPAVPNEIVQPLLLALVVTMLAAPFGIRYNKTFARLVLREKGPPQRAIERDDAATSELAKREHVVLCGFGRVGQNIARVLESQGFEYIAVDLDPARVRPARQAGYPVIFGDSTDEDVLHACGLANASAVIVSFANPAVSLGIVRAVREQRSRCADSGAHGRRPGHGRALRRWRNRSSARNLRGQPHAGVAGADAAECAGDARGAHRGRDPPRALCHAAWRRASGFRGRTGRPR